MNLKKLIYLICFASVALANTSCTKFLDVDIEGEQNSDSYWNTQADAKAVLMGAYSAMRDDITSFINWSDLRGDVMILGPGALTNEEMLEFKNLQIKEENSLCKWNKTYKTIARCNTLLENVESVCDNDDTFTEELCASYMAEAVWIRSLNYFTLVRTFGDVPYIKWSYVNDDQEFQVAKSNGSVILDDVLSDLATYYVDAPETNVETWETKGRVTRGAFFALMADISLWRERYTDAIMWCDSVDNLGLYSLVDSSQWYSLYNPGNAKESIFELQWDYDYSQTNTFYKLFCYLSSSTANQTYAISNSAISMYTEYSDIDILDVRGEGGTYKSDARVWKYGGQSDGESERSASEYDQNWIFYRYADVMLMRAEALIMTGNYTDAYNLIIDIRERAGYNFFSQPEEPVNESTALTMLMNERMREFAFEGKRWFDLVRWASIKEYAYKDNLIQLLLKNVPASQRATYESRLKDVNGFYLPIHKDDITAGGGVLEQNSYYQ